MRDVPYTQAGTKSRVEKKMSYDVAFMFYLYNYQAR